MPLCDILKQQNAIKEHTTSFVLWPKAWATFACAHLKSWDAVRLRAGNRGAVPGAAGIYTLLVQPGIAKHPGCSYLMYVGQTKDLRRRFGEYLSAERREAGRPRILRLLNLYDRYMWFCYAEVDAEHLTASENALLAAHMPPCNDPDQIPAEVRRGRKAF